MYTIWSAFQHISPLRRVCFIFLFNIFFPHYFHIFLKSNELQTLINSLPWQTITHTHTTHKQQQQQRRLSNVLLLVCCVLFICVCREVVVICACWCSYNTECVMYGSGCVCCVWVMWTCMRAVYMRIVFVFVEHLAAILDISSIYAFVGRH